ncbi:MAG: hypothetical protein GC154_18415 [bacterium]|nr:hypothetical protein [bacterium]
MFNDMKLNPRLHIKVFAAACAIDREETVSKYPALMKKIAEQEQGWYERFMTNPVDDFWNLPDRVEGVARWLESKNKPKTGN